MKNYFKKSLSFVLILSLTYLPVSSQTAMADSTDDQFHKSCDNTMKRMSLGGKDKDSSGDTQLAACAQADVIRQAKEAETVKSIIYLTVATACTTAAVIQYVEHGKSIKDGAQAVKDSEKATAQIEKATTAVTTATTGVTTATTGATDAATGLTAAQTACAACSGPEYAVCCPAAGQAGGEAALAGANASAGGASSASEANNSAKSASASASDAVDDAKKQVANIDSNEKEIKKIGKICKDAMIAASLAGVGIDVLSVTTSNQEAKKYDAAKDQINLVSSFMGEAGSLIAGQMMGGMASDFFTSKQTDAANAANKQAQDALTKQEGEVSKADAQKLQTSAQAALDKANATMDKIKAGTSQTTTATCKVQAKADAAAAGFPPVSSALCVSTAGQCVADSATALSNTLTAESNVIKFSSDAVKAAADAEKLVADSTIDKTCTKSALSMAILSAQSLMQVSGSKKALEDAVSRATQIKDTSENSITQVGAQQLSTTQAGGQHTANNTSNTKPGTSPTPSATGCSAQSGSAYLSCIGKTAPEVSAITNSADFMNSMSDTLHGKNLGDFAKGYNGSSSSDMANYVASGMGVSPSVVSAVMKGGQDMSKAFGGEKYTPMTYKSSGSAPRLSSGGDDLDFSKMMSGLMGKMGPGDGSESKVKDPSELVFRQMELLPADKIQANKDISLFARIAFRYRKNTANVDQLNWSATQNQGGPAPAQK